MQHTGNLQQTVRNIYLELNVLLCLNHPNIVRFYGMVGRFPPSGSSEPLELGMVFEFCEDGNLHTLLFRQKRMLTFPERIAIARDVASAMVHVHGLNIIHRDLSSPNILLAKGLQARESRPAEPTYVSSLVILGMDQHCRAQQGHSFGLHLISFLIATKLSITYYPCSPSAFALPLRIFFPRSPRAQSSPF